MLRIEFDKFLITFEFINCRAIDIQSIWCLFQVIRIIWPTVAEVNRRFDSASPLPVSLHVGENTIINTLAPMVVPQDGN